MSEADAHHDLAVRMADAVRPLVRKHFRSGLSHEVKPDASPVTAADREAETVIRDMIGAAFPEHGIFGEEFGRVNEGAPFVWVIDPIDGTKSFVTGKPLFGTLIALLRDGEPILGLIEMPALGERWVGRVGFGTTFNGAPVRTRPCEDLASAWLYATSPAMFQGGDAPAYDRLQSACYAAVYGADCYAYGLLANGTVDLVCEARMQPYDYCALVPVVAGAGGVITDWAGAPLGLASDGRVLAGGSAAVHAEARATLQG